ncbi:MAG: hypothetical protein ACFE8N_03380 [Promethearchaeota archaeon]
MTIEEKVEVRLFGLRLNNTAATILFFIALTTILNEIPYLYFSSQEIIQMFDYAIPDLIIFETIINFSIPLLVTGIFFYVLTISATIQKKYQEEKAITHSWFGFRLNKPTFIILLLLSILFLTTNFRNLVTSIINIIGALNAEIYLYAPYVMNQFFLMIGISILIISIYIYTIIICLKNRKNLR